MATGPITNISDLIVPEIFTGLAQNVTTEKSNILGSGALVRDPTIDGFLAGEGTTFNARSFKDLDNDEENISNDTADDRYVAGQKANSVPFKTGTLMETAVRLSRNNSWATADLNTSVVASDPMTSIVNRVGEYWARRLQRTFIATVSGIFASEAADPTDGSTHTKGDMTNDLSVANGGVYQAGLTDFSAPAFLDAIVTMGDSMGELGMLLVHSLVYNRMQKNNLITFIPDARGEVNIPTFQGHKVVMDDSMPFDNGVFESWIFGAGAFRLGMGSPKVPVEVSRRPESGNGGGSEVLYNRIELCIHPAGYAWTGTAPEGGPSNSAASNGLAAASSWERRFPERKQIKMARLITREMAAA